MTDWCHSMDAFLRLSGTEQASLIRKGKISSRELVHAHQRHIALVNTRLNAVVEVLQATAAADEADQALARGQPVGPLHGVPFTVKDSIEVAGSICTAGTQGRADAPPCANDATLVRRLRNLGAIPIARTNTPDLLFAFETDNLIHGRTHNPYDPDRTAGGSSGGEAAIIAACGSPLGLGSDAAGSVRVPAAFCGIVSIKPTSGRLPRTGHYPPAGGWLERIWQIGPMSRHTEDLRTVMPFLIAADGVDTTHVPMPLGNAHELLPTHLRVAFYTDNGFASPEPAVKKAVIAAARALASRGAQVTEDRPACLAAAYDLEMQFIGPDGGDSLRRFLASVGSRQLHPLLEGWLQKLEPYRTDLAGFERFWTDLDRYRAEMAAFARDYDVILAPVYAGPALLHGKSIEDACFRGFSYTMAFNVCGWPAGVVRCATSPDGLPLGVQIAAAPWREDIVLAVASWLEESFGGWQDNPFSHSMI